MIRHSFIAGLLALFCVTANSATEQGANAGSGNFTQVLLGLLAVLGLMAATAWLLKRFGVRQFTGNASVKIVGGVSVGARERILVVETAGQWIVVGVTPGRINALATMPRQEIAPEPPAPITRNFSEWLKYTIEKRNAK
ncbi:MAG: flagellar biosynthetic protein FliO [Oxalobacteraceae bacterium]|nr:flagellar biosynthetic protein FliO [Oxalobacteraceae bacterium]